LPNLSAGWDHLVEAGGEGTEIKAVVFDILDLVKAYNLILATGHLSGPEVKALVIAAHDRGLRRIIVTHPFYAAVNLSLSGKQMVIDSRPSDAIALALRTKSPIYVAKAVLEASSVLQQTEEGKDTTVENVSKVSKEKWGEILEKMGPEDFKYKQ
jgi:bifunctional DNase/RNase